MQPLPILASTQNERA